MCIRDRLEAEGHPGQETHLGVRALDQPVGQPVLEAGVDRDTVLGDPLGQVDESGDPAAPGPGQPMVEQALAVLALEREDLTQLLLEQVGPVEAVVDLGDPGQLGRLLVGEVFGVLPQRVPGVFEVAGVPAGPLLAGRVPCLAANLVQGVCGAPPRCGTDLRTARRWGTCRRPRRRSTSRRRRDVRDGGTPRFTEGGEELRQRLAVSTRRGPHQPATVVIHDESDVSVPALVADLPGRPGAAMRPAYPARSRSLFGCLGRARGNEASRSESSRPSTPCCNRWFGGWSSRASRTWRWSRPGCTGSRSSTPCARAIPWRSCRSTPGM